MNYLKRITKIVTILIFLYAAIAYAEPLVTTSVIDNGGDSGWNYKFVGSPASIAIGKDDTVHIVYYDASNNSFKYARRENSTWRTETIDAFGTNRQSVSIAIDKQGAVHVLYSADLDNLTSETRYAVYNDEWSVQSVATIPSGWYSYGSKILITDDGTIHLLYSGAKLHHTISKDGGWETSTLFDLGTYKWRATEKNGSLYLSHGSYGIGERLLIGIYGQETGSWLYRNFDTDLTYTDQTPVAIDSSGKIHVVGYGRGDGLTHIEMRSDLTIDERVLDYSGGHSGVFNDMVMDGSDSMHILFSVLDYWPNKILGTWYCYVPTVGGIQFTTIETGQYTTQSIAIDSVGNLHIAYYDQVRGDLKYAELIYNTPISPDLPHLLNQIQVSQLYVSIFGRASEGEGNAYWQSEQSDMTVAANTMLNTEPAKAYFGETLNDNQMFIEFIYKNTLGKDYADDPEGVNYWVSELVGGKSKGQVVATLINAAIDPKYAGLPAQDQFLNKVSVSNYTADKITTVPDVNDLSAFVDFISGVTDDAATVVAAKAAVDAF